MVKGMGWCYGFSKPAENIIVAMMHVNKKWRIENIEKNVRCFNWCWLCEKVVAELAVLEITQKKKKGFKFIRTSLGVSVEDIIKANWKLI